MQVTYQGILVRSTLYYGVALVAYNIYLTSHRGNGMPYYAIPAVCGATAAGFCFSKFAYDITGANHAFITATALILLLYCSGPPFIDLKEVANDRNNYISILFLSSTLLGASSLGGLAVYGVIEGAKICFSHLAKTQLASTISNSIARFR